MLHRSGSHTLSILLDHNARKTKPMELVSTPEDLNGWELTKFIDDERLNALMSGSTGQIHSERLYTYCLRLPRGYVTVNAWYYPGSDPEGEYPFEIQFYFCISDGEILKELSLFDPDLNDQFLTIKESTADLAGFFLNRMSMNVAELLSILGAEPPDVETEQVDITSTTEDVAQPDVESLLPPLVNSTLDQNEGSDDDGPPKRIRKVLRTQTRSKRD